MSQRTRRLYHEMILLPNPDGEVQHLPPGLDQASWEVIIANKNRLKRGPFDEILAQYPFETLYCAVDLLSNNQISSVNDESFERFLRAIPDIALEFAGWKLSKTQIRYCVKNHPNTILFYAPALLTPSQLRRCTEKSPETALLRAASQLVPDDLVSVCFIPIALGLDQALLENAYRLAPHHFALLLKNPNTRDALARIFTGGNLKEPVIVITNLLKGRESLSEAEYADAESVIREITSRI